MKKMFNILLIMFSMFATQALAEQETNNPKEVNIEKGGNVGTNDPEAVNIDNGGNEGTHDPSSTDIDQGGNEGVNPG